MKKIKWVVLALLLSVTAAAGCSQKNADSGKGTESTVKQDESGSGGKDETAARTDMSCEEILDELLKRISTTNCDTRTFYGEQTYDEYFEYLYEVKLEKAEDGAFGYASASYADEITVIRLSDAGDADMFMDKFDERIERRKRDFEGYKPEEVEKLKKAEKVSKGSYVFLAVCRDSDKAAEEFLKIIGED